MGKEKMYYEELGYDFDPPFYRTEDKPVVTNADWRSCANCKKQECYRTLLSHNIETEKPCDGWEPIQCPYCGGAMSEIREHNGRRYRHCYSCHMEPEVK